MSILGSTGGVVADKTDNGAVDVEAVGGTTDALKVFTRSDLVRGTAARDEDIGAETSSIDPNATAEPVHRGKKMRKIKQFKKG